MKLLIALAALAAWPALAAEPTPKDRIERGRYLVNITGCADCHTPLKVGAKGPEQDLTRQFAGHPQELDMPPVPALPAGPWQVVSSGTNTAWAGPWGVSFTANLTPDVETGLGGWSEQQFVQTMRVGLHLGSGRPLLPPMPVFAYQQMTESDLAAVFAYLKTVPAVRNRVPAPLLPPQR
jgi:mono/diheme cytochrome c family protein